MKPIPFHKKIAIGLLLAATGLLFALALISAETLNADAPTEQSAIVPEACNTNISGTIFEDINGNGVFDPGEAGVYHVAVQVKDALTGTVLKKANTFSNGQFNFKKLGNGKRIVSIKVPTGYTATTKKRRTVTLPPCRTVDFGLRPNPTVTPTPSVTPSVTPTPTTYPTEPPHCVALPIGTPQPTITPPAGLSDSPWPMYQHDPAHRGLSPNRGIDCGFEILWQTDLNLERYIGVAPGISIGADGTLYIAAYQHLLAYDLQDGTLKWDSGFRGATTSQPAIAADNTLYWGYDDALQRLSPTGQQIWRIFFSSAGIWSSSPAIGPDGKIYFVHNAQFAQNNVPELDWWYPYNFFSQSSPALDGNGNVYSTTGLREFHAFDANGNLKWTVPETSMEGPSIGTDGTIYEGAWSPARLIARDANGNEKWVFETDEKPCAESYIYHPPAIAADGTLYFATSLSGCFSIYQAHVYAVNPDGTLKWKYPIPGPVGGLAQVNAPVILDKFGRPIVCSDAGGCYAFDTNGNVLWQFAPKFISYHMMGASIPANGIVVVLDGWGKLYALADQHMPRLQAAPHQLVFTANDAPSNQAISLTSTLQPVNWQLSIPSGVTWLQASAMSGTTPQTIQFETNTTGLAAGTYQTVVKLTAGPGDVGNSPLPILITLTVP